MKADAVAICRRHEALRQARHPHEAGWDECFGFSFPERAHGLNGTTVLPQDATSKKARILDDTAADSARILASGIVSGTTPANSLWFGMEAGQATADGQEDEEAKFLDEASRVIFDNIHAANFDAAAYECAVDLVAAG